MFTPDICDYCGKNISREEKTIEKKIEGKIILYCSRECLFLGHPSQIGNWYLIGIICISLAILFYFLYMLPYILLPDWASIGPDETTLILLFLVFLVGSVTIGIAFRYSLRKHKFERLQQLILNLLDETSSEATPLNYIVDSVTYRGVDGKVLEKILDVMVHKGLVTKNQNEFIKNS